MATHVMLDIETFSLARNATLLAIGAVKFNPNQPAGADGLHQIEDAILIGVDPRGQERFNRHIDPGTVMWWLDENRAAARAALLNTPLLDLGSALDVFAEWFGGQSLPVWGNGSSFDNEVVKSAFEAINQPVPWTYKDDRCYRTIKNLAPGLPVPQVGVEHQALDDATAQAFHLQDIVAHLGLQL